MFRAWKITSRPITTLRTATFIAALTTASLLPMLSNPSIAHADSVVQAGTAWLGGSGVDIMTGGDGSHNCVSVSGAPAQSQCNNVVGKVYSGDKWQCVEMVNRLYLTKGWTTTTWWGNGNSIINDLSNHPGLTDQLQDHISYVNPGDVVTETHSTDGHAGVINSIDANGTIHIKSQNADLDSQASITSGSLAAGTAHYALSGWIGYSVQAIAHHPSSQSTTAKPVALQFGSEMDVYKRGGDGAIWKDTWNTSTWSGWNSLGGGLASDPAAIQYNSEMDVFATATNGQVVKDTWNGTSWSGWNSLGGNMTGTPSAVQYGSSEMDVYARNASDNHIYKDTWNGTSWSGWNSLGGSIAGNPKAMIYGGSEMDVWARGTDGNIYKDGWNGSSWGGFSSMGNGGSSMVGDPAAIQYSSEMDVYIDAANNELYKDTWNGSSWSGWIGMPGVSFAGSPAALQFSTEMDVYARGKNDSYIYKDTWQPSTNSWSGWNSMGGNEATDPSAIQYGSSEMDLYANNYAFNTDKDTWNGSSWSGLTGLL